MTKRFLLLLLLLSTQVMAKELPSWGMTETQYKMPNFITKMKNIGNQAVNNDWLLKITAPKDWHSKIRAALSEQGTKNVQINFKDSLYKSISITATPGMSLKSTTTENKQPDVIKKQVVIEKPEMDTEIEAPEFDNDFKTEDILADIGEIELQLPNNDQDNKSVKSNNKQVNKTISTEKKASNPATTLSQNHSENNTDIESLKKGLRMRYTRNNSVDKSISYANITHEDDLYIADNVVLVKRYINRGVAVFYWMTEAYDPSIHTLVEKSSGKYIKSETDANQSKEQQTQSDKSNQNFSNSFFDFVAITDNREDQDELRHKFIRYKGVNLTIKSSQLKSGDILYVKNQTVLVVRPLGNSRSAYFWLEGETDIQQAIETKGPQHFVIQ